MSSSALLVVLDLDKTIFNFYADNAASAAKGRGFVLSDGNGHDRLVIKQSGDCGSQGASATTVWSLHSQARIVINHLLAHPEQFVVRIASASNSGGTARAMLQAYGFPSRLWEGSQIYSGDKTKHLNDISRETGIPLSQAIFFDDAPVFCKQAELAGVVAIRVDPNVGITMRHLLRGVQVLKNRSSAAKFMQQFLRGSSKKGGNEKTHSQAKSLSKPSHKWKSGASSRSSSSLTSFFSSKSSSKALSSSKTTRFTECPVCGKSIFIAHADSHVIKCLQAKPSKDSSVKSSSSPPRSTHILSQLAQPSSSHQGLAISPRRTAPIFKSPSKRMLITGRNFRGHEKLPGVHVFEDFVSLEEEEQLLTKIDASAAPWALSRWNGLHLNKEWGRRIVFDQSGSKPVAMMDDASKPLPKFLQDLSARFTSGKYLPTAAFRPNQCNAITYVVSQGHHISPHFDDRRLSGEMLANLSLVCDATMVYERGTDRVEVFLKRGSLQVVTGEARYRWKHSIPNEKIEGPRRVSLTFRRQGADRVQVSSSSSRLFKKRKLV